jgi:molybdenum cofactor guanylyltransferase
MNNAAEIAGIVLAGGRATRLGGGDKPLREIGGRPMLAHVLERLKPQARTLAISANGDPARFAEYGLPVLADEAGAGQAGPLVGILSGMRWAKTAGSRKLLTVAGDTPFFPIDLAARLGEAVTGAERRIAVATSGGRRHPVFGLWPVSLEPDLAGFLSDSQTFSVSAFLEGHDAVSVDFPILSVGGTALDPFFNVNSPEDLAAAEAIAERLAR